MPEWIDAPDCSFLEKGRYLMHEDVAAAPRSRVRKPKQDRSRSSMERLLTTAVDMLAQRGFAEFTLQELSRRTKVSIGSIYLRFENKQELMREVQIRFLERVEREHALVINRLRRRGLGLRQLVPIAIREYSEFLRKHADLLRVFMELAPNDPIVAANGKKYYGQSAADFALLLLDRRAEIRHPDPVHAVGACFSMMYAWVGRYLGLGTTGDVMGEGDWPKLLDDVSQMAVLWLSGGDPQDGLAA
jgi:AcrR family transcriptional regulator